MIPTNSLPAVAAQLTELTSQPHLLLIIDATSAGSHRINDISTFPPNALQTAWNDGASITPITMKDAEKLRDTIIQQPESIMGDADMVSIIAVLFFAPNGNPLNNHQSIFYFERHSGCTPVFHDVDDLDTLAVFL